MGPEKLDDDDKRRKKMEIFLSEIEKYLRSIKPIVGKKLNDAKWAKNLNVLYPILNQPEHKSVETPFDFYPPERFDVVGDFRLNVSSSVVNLAVEMPEKMIGQRDYLNHTYHQKRAYFLMILASNLRNLPSVKSLEFCRNENEPLRPFLRLVPNGALLNRTEVFISPYPPKNVWKLKRFLPSVSNIRLSWYFGETEKDLNSTVRSISADGTNKKNSNSMSRSISADRSGDKNLQPTPNYNQSILSDILMVDFTERMLKDFDDSTTLREGVSLVKTWLRLRGLYDEFSNGVSSIFVNNFLRYLLKMKRITCQTNNYQVFRAFALAVSQNLLDGDGITLDESDDKIQTLKEFRKYFPFVFLDSNGCCNLCSHLDELTHSRLKHEASLAIEILDKNEFSDAFNMLYVKPVPFVKKYDQFFIIQLEESLVSTFRRESTSPGVLADLAGDEFRLITDRIVEILKKGLLSRILSIELFKSDPILKWKIDEESQSRSKILTFGVLINPESYNNPLEKGPSADTSAAADFRSFWGEKSEMRKFSDSSVCEAVVWRGENQATKRSVPSQIVKFILQKHLNIPPSCIKFIVDPLDAVITAPFLKGTGEEEYFSLYETYDRLSQSIRLLDGLPLAVGRIFSTDPCLRQTEILPILPILSPTPSLVNQLDDWTFPRPSAFSAPPWCPSLEVQITLESSAKWPDDVKAIQKLKTAFLIKIVELLKQQFQTFAVARDDCAFVYQNGYVFRLILVYPREVVLLKTSTTDGGLVRTKNTEASASLDKQINRRPMLCSFLNGISQQYPSYGLACRLVKRWISSHMLSGYVSDEALELVVAHVYLSPHPYISPGSSIAAFLRTLTILATFDWLKNPLILNLNNQLSKQDIHDIRAEFVKLRPTMPPMCIATPDDRLGVLWTRPQPNAMITERLINLARSSLNVLEINLLTWDLHFDPNVIFRTPLDVYDVLIHLLERQMPRRFMSPDDDSDEFFPSMPNKYQRKKRTSTIETQILPVVDYDPVELFVDELKTTYDDVVMVFYDKYGGNIVGLLWKPQKLTSSDKGISLVTTTKNGKNKNLKYAKLIENIEILGKGLVEKIEITEKEIIC